MPAHQRNSAAQPLGLLILCVLALGLTGLFGIWYSHEKSSEALSRLGDLTRLIDAARQAQVEFKIQVQDWKNLLLRGQNSDDFASYTKRFDAQNTLVQEKLQSVQQSPELPSDLKLEVGSILAAHTILLTKYHEAIARYSSTDPASIFAVDQSVRGLDQKLNDRIDAVAVNLVALESRQHEELRASGDKLYQDLRLVTGIAGLITIVCAVLLALSNRRTAVR